MGGTGFSEWDYEKAFEYFDAMLRRAENNMEENDGAGDGGGSVYVRGSPCAYGQSRGREGAD